MCDRKSRTLTYLLSLLGGVFGLHHLYLGRTQHALLWLTTLGGFGIGLIYEILFLIPKYVAEANQDRFVVQLFKLQMLRKKSPAFEIFRLCGQYLTAVFYGFITCYAFPDTYHQQPSTSLFVGICTATAIGVGTKLAGTVGPRRCSFIWPWFGAMLGLPFLVRRADSSPSFNIPAILSSLIFEWRVEWDQDYLQSTPADKAVECQPSIPTKQPRRRRRHFVQRCLLFGLGALVFTSILGSAIYQNFQVQINGQPVKIKDVLTNFFKSQEFIRLSQQLSTVMQRLWHFYLQYGLKGIWTQIWAALDSENDKQAFGILNLTSDASQKAIEAQCRTLSRQWHPDRYRDSEQKQKAQISFMNVQQACDRLSDERKRRQSINTQKRENPR